MQLIVVDPSYDREHEFDRAAFVSELETQLGLLAPEYAIRESDIGRGADWPVFLAILSGLFFLGKPIYENLGAWKELATKLIHFIKWARERGTAARLDETATKLIALHSLDTAERGNLTRVNLLSSSLKPTWTNERRIESDLDHHPEGVCEHTFEIDDGRVYVIVVDSDGTVLSQRVAPRRV